jgi:hypothetical protein
MAAGGISAVFTLITILIFAIGGTAIISDPDARDALPGIGVLLMALVAILALNGLTIYAGWEMRNLRAWNLALAGSIIAMLPCSACCILGLPMGIWALIVLIDNDVKQAFRSNVPPGGPGGYDPPPGGYGA